MRLRNTLLTGFVVVLVLGACGGSKSANKTTPSTAKAVSNTTLGQGVTATTINVGVMMIDYKCVEAVYDQQRPDQQQAFDIFFKQINDTGGVNGRMLKPVYESYCPIRQGASQEACTALTEDTPVFAAIGVFFSTAGDAQLCFTKRHNTVVIADSLNQKLVDAARPGLLLTPDIAPERRLKVILSLLKSKDVLQGKKVAVLSDVSRHAQVTDVAAPGLRDLGVSRGTDASLSISSADTTTAQAQLDAAIEHWKSEGTNGLVLVGNEVTATQFIEKIKKKIPDMQLVADTTSILDQGQAAQKAHVSPNPYTGAITAEGQTGEEHTKTEHFAFCRDTWEKATGRKVPSPLAVVKLPNGKQDDIYGEVEDACLYTNFFATIAKKVGPYLNNDNWVNTVDNFGPVDDTSTIYASLHAGKYDADDTYGLVSFDPAIGEAGDWQHVTPIQNVSG